MEPHWGHKVALTNVRLGQKIVKVLKTLAYYNVASITAVKSLIVQAEEGFFGSWLVEYI